MGMIWQCRELKRRIKQREKEQAKEKAAAAKAPVASQQATKSAEEQEEELTPNVRWLTPLIHRDRVMGLFLESVIISM
jgi:hypothetical protein